MQSSQQSIPMLLRRFWTQIPTRRQLQLKLLVVLMIAASFAEVFSVSAVLPFLGVLTAPQQVFDHELAQPLILFLDITQPEGLLLPITILFGIAAIIAGLMRIALLWAQTRLSYSIGADIGVSIYNRTLYQPYTTHVSRNSSEVIAGITTKSYNLVIGALYPSLTLLSSTFIMSTIFVALVIVDPTIALSIFLGFGVVYYLVILATKRRVAKDSQRVSEESVKVIKSLHEGLGGIRDVLIDGAQETYTSVFKNASVPYEHARASIHILSGIPRFGVESLGMLLIAVVAYSIASSGGNIVGSIPVLGALAVGAQRILPVLQQTYAAFTSIRGYRQSVQDALDLLEQPLPDHAKNIQTNELPFNKGISLSNLSFRYTSEGPVVLRELNIFIPKGARIGFVGVTGSGKSTLLDIIMGLLQPTDGTLAIDGVKITNRNCHSWQRHVAHVPQSIFLADASIAENIAFGVEPSKIDHDRVKDAASKAQISEMIEASSDGYLTLVGERGMRLSGGQRQRIGIARALYKNANVIIFDEATSALDGETESAVMNAIESLSNELTLLIIAHRISTLRNCDQIMELADGKIVSVGTYEDLRENVG